MKNNFIKNKIKNKIKKENHQNKKIMAYEGVVTINDEILPAYIDTTNPKYLEIDEVCHAGLIIYNYNREYEDIILKELIDSNISMDISIFYERQDPVKTIRDLTYHIGNVGVEIKDNNNQNRQDIDIASFTYNDAKYIRKEIQVNNEELYFLYIYLEIFARDTKELEYLLSKVEGMLQSKGMKSKRAYFRQEQNYLATLPLMENHEDIKVVAKRNVLTNGLVATYPFISSSIFDENGIFIGSNYYNNSLIFIDRFNTEKYKNANMCIFGTSGAGKSFFTKLMILRSRLIGIEQYIIDPEREYTNICEKLNGTLLKIGPSSKSYVNILDIRQESIEDGEEGYLATKIGKLIGFFNLIFGELNEKEKAILEEKLIECYRLKRITFDDMSLFEYKNHQKIFKDTNQMPILKDLYDVFNEDPETKIFAIKLIPFIRGSLKFFNHHTNIQLNNNLIVADVYELGEENLKYGLFIFTDLFWDLTKKNRKIKKAIYLDEIWRLIRGYFQPKRCKLYL